MSFCKPHKENQPQTHTPDRFSQIIWQSPEPCAIKRNPAILISQARDRKAAPHTMQCALTLHVSPFADTADSTGPHSVSRRSKLMVYIQGHQWNCTETTHFLLSPDLVGFQRMPFPSAGPWVHTTLMTSTVVREKQELLQEWRNHSRMAICYCKGCRRGNSSRPCWECHNGQELYLLAKSTTVWVITLFLSRNARGDFLLKFWPAAKKEPGSDMHAVCHGQSAPSPDPQPTFQEATTAERPASPLPTISNFLATGKEKW